jgi:uncharacterized protein YjbI with pentapeptide repeats
MTTAAAVSEPELLKPTEARQIVSALLSHARYLAGQRDARRASFAWCDMAHVNLEGVDLRHAEMTGVRLEGAVLSKARLDGANLFGADLRDTDLRGASLQKADLRGACLRGANLSHADLTGADLRVATIALQDSKNGFRLFRHEARDGEMAYAVATGARMGGQGGASIFPADLSDSVMAGAVIKLAKMPHAILDGADLTGADITGCDLRGASLKRAVLTGVSDFGAEFQGADLEGALRAPPPIVYIDDEPLPTVPRVGRCGCGRWTSGRCAASRAVG